MADRQLDEGKPTVHMNFSLSMSRPALFLRRPLLAVVWITLALPGCSSGPVVARQPPPVPRGGAPAAPPNRPALPPPAPSEAKQPVATIGNAALAAELDRVAAAASGQLVARRMAFGTSASGEPLQALSLSRTDAAHARPVVLLVGQQRTDDHRSAQALLDLARQLTGGEASPVLDRVDVLLVPRLNPDGAAAGSIESDHLLLDTPEARSLAILARQYDPALVLDVQDLPPGSADAYSVDAAQASGTAAFMARAAREWFRLPLTPGSPVDGKNADAAAMPTASAGSLSAAGGLMNAVALRVALQPLPSGRGAPDVLLRLLKLSAQRADDLAKLRHYVRADVAASACRGDVVLDGQRTLPRPCAYWIAADEAIAVERLRAFDIEIVTLDRPVSVLGSLYQPPAEGRHAQWVDALVDMPAGSHYVPMSQARANLVAAALEPDSMQGYLRHGLITDPSHIARLRGVADIAGNSPPGSGKTP